MKTERAYGGGRISATAAGEGGYSPIFVTAGLAVLVLGLAIGYEIERSFAPEKASVAASASPQDETATSDLNAELGALFSPEVALNGEPAADATSSDSTALGNAVISEVLNRYDALQSQGLYTPEVGQKAAEKLAADLQAKIAFQAYAPTDIKSDNDTSKERVLRYRDELRASLAPLLENKDPEFEVFARYIDSRDQKYLDQLRAIAKNYSEAAAQTAAVVVPRDAAPYHAAILNALSEFAATLSALADNGADPFASVVVLRSYNQAEADVIAAFKALVTYQKQKLS